MMTIDIAPSPITVSVDNDLKNSCTSPVRKHVGIVGAGPAGLYSAMLLQRQGYMVHIFEASNRVGGRIYTHRFNNDKNQYFEAGAMRVPISEYQRPFFDLVDEINRNEKTDSEHRVKLIPYILETPQNRFHLNKLSSTYAGARISGSGDLCAADVCWPGFTPTLPGAHDFYRTPIRDLLTSVLDPLFKIIAREGFEQGFNTIVELYDDFSFRFYLKSVHLWPDAAIDFVETAASQTNQFSLSVVELFMQNMDFSIQDWVTIADGMDRLPWAMANIVGLDNITLNAPVTEVQELENGKVQVQASGADGILEMSFDHVVFAIPPAALQMIPSRPHWGADKELAIRSMHFEALWKIGMRFKTRFWETQAFEYGGQSTTDLPIRWIVLPSYGIGDEGPGVLLFYAWFTDAQAWLPLSPSARRALAMSCLEQAYPDVDDLRELLIETFDVTWSSESATGDAMFLPGQWRHFEVARRPEKNIYFAGEHISYHHTWITGALVSASYTVKQISESDWYFDATVEGLRLESGRPLAGRRNPGAGHTALSIGPKVTHIPGPAKR